MLSATSHHSLKSNVWALEVNVTLAIIYIVTTATISHHDTFALAY